MKLRIVGDVSLWRKEYRLRSFPKSEECGDRAAMVMFLVEGQSFVTDKQIMHRVLVWSTLVQPFLRRAAKEQ